MEKFGNLQEKGAKSLDRRPGFIRLTIINDRNKIRRKICPATLEENAGSGLQSWVSSNCYSADMEVPVVILCFLSANPLEKGAVFAVRQFR
ncbi:hypothetical protein ACIPF8_11040 [Collimonas sp. NPDC087041]|uniref:hypothetical protein n=1 Tax=Collimonas sp. NPDC087041 TaxID=3363960 RepID=UPI0037F26C01